MYHVVANLDSRFKSLEEALAEFNTQRTIFPGVPHTRSCRENPTVPRICVAQNICDCFTAIGLQNRLHRCLSACEGCFSYAQEGMEAYPILVVEFSEDQDYYRPFLTEVPDCDVTNEYWILTPSVPERVEVKWLSMFSFQGELRQSIHLREPKLCCTSVNFIADEELVNYNHPWLNDKGHTLDSTSREEEA